MLEAGVSSLQGDMGPSVSRAIEARDNVQFEKLSYCLKRTGHGLTRCGGGGRSQDTLVAYRQGPRGVRARRRSRRRLSYDESAGGLLPADLLAMKDDNDLSIVVPGKYVDYLNYNWRGDVRELWNSWKFLAMWKRMVSGKFRGDIPDLVTIGRLENIIWRIWLLLVRSRRSGGNAGAARKHEVVLPEGDVPWLYGPIVTSDYSSVDVTARETTAESATAAPTATGTDDTLKPILKKTALGEQIVENSIWKLKQMHQWKQEVKSNVIDSEKSILQDVTSTDGAPSRHITFDTTVHQYIALSNSISPFHSSIRLLPDTHLNYSSDEDSDGNGDGTESGDGAENGDGTEQHWQGGTAATRNAVSHNTSRSHTYFYDYNSVYTNDVSSLIPCTDPHTDVLDVPENLNLLGLSETLVRPLEVDATPPVAAPLSPRVDGSEQQPPASPLPVTKTRDFITGEFLQAAETPATPVLHPQPAFKHSVSSSTFVLTSDDEENALMDEPIPREDDDLVYARMLGQRSLSTSNYTTTSVEESNGNLSEIDYEEEPGSEFSTKIGLARQWDPSTLNG
ncbi:uncharacterized protein KNAG_0J00910 [Huiozyma naganishii CBS 8797]|uniref:Nitrogen regulatory protein areA GATA-like domain-containing protein n=1 Tax=Huiozyma naganishii (strain ATCC MYA-139 / BCRC 22969 / CBS 8797 / KCTC 17520 / NBRC 10181 / NCYC 3082 / Yp74L-3) TaxID=1071383 RepID=J7RQS9_HUIN7|nr:hypothetical protein KNAG_0J00910 [Kazachstania naganishii CBS 8797]CCK72173.1 hypothetical protein KNAG_0J00910 [Kazachstania naganishii CBS 8797]